MVLPSQRSSSLGCLRSEIVLSRSAALHRDSRVRYLQILREDTDVTPRTVSLPALASISACKAIKPDEVTSSIVRCIAPHSPKYGWNYQLPRCGHCPSSFLSSALQDCSSRDKSTRRARHRCRRSMPVGRSIKLVSCINVPVFRYALATKLYSSSGHRHFKIKL